MNDDFVCDLPPDDEDYLREMVAEADAEAAAERHYEEIQAAQDLRGDIREMLDDELPF